MKLFEIMKAEVIKMCIKKTRGKTLKNYVKDISKDANPKDKNNISAKVDVVAATPEEQPGFAEDL